MQTDTRPPGDAAFLIHGAEHLLKGHSMTGDYYDNNPPMSFLVYTPVIFLKNIPFIPSYMASNLFTLILIFFSLITVHILLKAEKETSSDTKFIALSSCALAMTISVITEFGQKDHLVVIGLIPFILAQRLITERPTEQTLWTFLILCLFTPFILIKPHYGLIPTAIILHRAITQKRINTCLDHDVIALGAGAITYIAYIITAHPDFINEIIPLARLLYIANPIANNTIFNAFIFFFFTMALSLIIKLSAAETKDKKQQKDMALFFALAATLSVIPFGVQNKGFSLHLIPTVTLSITALGIYLPTVIKHKLNTLISLCSMSFALYIYIFTSFIFKGHPITHEKYLKSDIIKVIAENAADGGFFIEDNTTCATYTSALYTDNKVASRFPSMWIMNGALALNNEDKKIETLDKFGKYIAEDFNNFKPQMIAFMLNEEGKSPLKVIYYKHEPFQTALSHYKFKKKIEINDIYPCYRGKETEDKKLTLEIYTRNE